MAQLQVLYATAYSTVVMSRSLASFKSAYFNPLTPTIAIWLLLYTAIDIHSALSVRVPWSQK